MAPHTTPADVATYTGVTYTSDQVTRMATLIPIAERWVRRAAGQDFYDAGDPASDASQDWLYVTSLVVEHDLAAETPEAKAAAQGPYQSEKLGDYSYTLKSTGSASGTEYGPKVWEVLAPYTIVTVPALVMNGPTRVAPVLCDPDVDISRGLW